jgi:hypothetical protein
MGCRDRVVLMEEDLLKKRIYPEVKNDRKSSYHKVRNQYHGGTATKKNTVNCKI